MSFSQALSGLAAQSENLKVVSNNIANSQTVGFKSGSVAFADVFAGANSKVGLGTKVAGITQDFTSGDLENTGRNLDLAIAGDGFYRLEKTSGEAVFSRNGQFSRDNEGFIVNANGQKLTGYTLEQNEDFPFSDLVVGGAPQPINIPQDDMPARATGASDAEDAGVQAVYNLDASIDHTDASLENTAKVYADLAEKQGDNDPSEEIDYHYSSSYTAYDSLGNAHVVSVYFEKTGQNTWGVTTAVNGINAGNNFTLNFSENGKLTTDADNNISGVGGSDRVAMSFPNAILGTGAEDLDFDFILAGTTQFANNSTNVSLKQDGYTSGSLAGLEVLEDGTIMRNYTNEQRVAGGQVVLTTFANVEGLQPDGDNAWRATNASGEPVLGVAGTGLFGTVQSGVLENSNVDLAKQLVDMIVAQRAYQANSSSISTQDELLQTVIQL